MTIYPAMDLLEGRCVRLYKGDYDQSTNYGDDPLSIALEFERQGAQWLHIVDLQAAKDPNNPQTELIKELITKTNLSIQVGGGIRQSTQVSELIEQGVSRVMIGSLAVKEPELLKVWFNQWNEKILLTLDVRVDASGTPFVATNGWQNTSDKALFDIINDYLPYGLQHFLCTDIDFDGTLQGPNLALYQKLINAYPSLNCIASGGVSSLSDLDKLREINVSGVVIGKALYEQKFTLDEALQKS